MESRGWVKITHCYLLFDWFSSAIIVRMKIVSRHPSCYCHLLSFVIVTHYRLLLSLVTVCFCHSSSFDGRSSDMAGGQRKWSQTPEGEEEIVQERKESIFVIVYLCSSPKK